MRDIQDAVHHCKVIISSGAPQSHFVEPSMAGPQKPMWQKSSAELVALFAELAPQDPAVTQKKMFGWPCCFVNGNLFAGLHKESMIFRLSDDDRVAFLRLDGAADFEPMPGPKMRTQNERLHDPGGPTP
jgi:hypothetical protein